MTNLWDKYLSSDEEKINNLITNYKYFLNHGKTERECISQVIKKAEEQGFKSLDYYITNKIKIESGSKIYVENMHKAIALFVIGKDDIEMGMNILGVHIDSPRIDLKATPLYEKENLAYFNTHYYGGIKKYQWVTLPLAMHGVIVKKDGTMINLNIGENLAEPLFCITDLLPHLAQKQLQKEGNNIIEGENLDILIGSKPVKNSKDCNLVKENILKILQEKYNIEEEDFISSEIEFVPAGEARDCGLDKSLVMGYGQDDRVCAYTSIEAFFNVENPPKTISCILVDKEEIGSVGASSMKSKFYLDAIDEICSLMNKPLPITTSRILKNSKMLSSDVNAAYDPLYANVMDKATASYLNKGVVFCKYTGSQGKSNSNDANAEFLAHIRKIMDDAKISYQVSELGKVDIGGGGTIAYILANENVEVIDCGIAILNMHAPWEITSKIDIYEVYKCYLTFLKNA